MLLLNPDTLVLDHAVDRLVAFAGEHPDAGVWGGRTVFADGSLNAASCWAFMSVWSLFAQAIGLTTLFRDNPLTNPEGYGGWARDSVRKVDIVSGCFLLIRRELWEGLGGFDERFFMYAEEADLCYRAKQLGAAPLFTPDAAIVHYGGASERVRSAKTSRLLAAKVTFLRKHWSKRRSLVGIRLLELAVLIRTVGYSVLSYAAPARRSSAAEWRSVWLSREEWIHGYR